ncbi:putative glycoside hydrolase [Paenibacillus koleovorans]|uniref:putative glycoside hydrolase n=1 Tax=Paenibacillus koleovorans TaxID=121608 RepID=UPI000FD9E184|nr:putative glycoside hydrolase [Paenibacillus koleovorans]
MELLFAALIALWGSLTGGSPDRVSMEQALQTYVQQAQAAQAAEQQAPNGSTGTGQSAVKKDPQTGTAPIVKGVYATAHSAAGSRMETLLKLMDETELNAMVIDVKDDFGYITYQTGNPELEALGTTQKIISNMPALMEKLNQHDVYPIARVVVFKDTVLAKQRPELSFRNPDGTLWNNGKNPPDSFLNPYRKEVWEYNVAVAKEAAKAGFKEIQFDYVRFPEGFETRADTLQYDRDDRARTDIVADFVKYAREQLAPLGVRVSVDIFGYAASVPAAEGIGQDFEKISKQVDVISPMVYPSHYGPGWFGSKVPDAAPYATINGAMADTHKKLEPLAAAAEKPIIRPWLQDFTASWVQGYIKYGKHEVEEQIRALHDNGIDEFLLWNAGNTYTPGVAYGVP